MIEKVERHIFWQKILPREDKMMSIVADIYTATVFMGGKVSINHELGGVGSQIITRVCWPSIVTGRLLMVW